MNVYIYLVYTFNYIITMLLNILLEYMMLIPTRSHFDV